MGNRIGNKTSKANKAKMKSKILLNTILYISLNLMLAITFLNLNPILFQYA